MDCKFGFFEELESYEDWAELNAFHDMMDEKTFPTYDEVNEILARFAEEGLVESIEQKEKV